MSGHNPKAPIQGGVARVIHLFRRMDQGGAESRTMDVYRNLNRQRTQFDFLVYSDRPGYFDREIASLGGRIFVIPPPDRRHLLRHIVSMYRVFRREGPYAAVHSHGAHYSGLVVAVARVAQVRVRVCHARTAPPTGSGNPVRLLYFLVSKASMLLNASNLLACSREAGRFLYGLPGMGSSRFRIVRNAIDLGKFKGIDPGARDRLRKSWGVPDTAYVLGHVGRFVDVKNHDFLIELVSSMVEKGGDAWLVLVGDGPLREKTELAAAKAGLGNRVLFLGSRSDVPEILSAIDCLLLPSRYEGVPGVVIEAQASGLPCLLSDRVSKEVDVGLGLLDFLPIDEGTDAWEKALEKVGARVEDPRTIVTAFQDSGYDVRSLIPILERIYHR